MLGVGLITWPINSIDTSSGLFFFDCGKTGADIVVKTNATVSQIVEIFLRFISIFPFLLAMAKVELTPCLLLIGEIGFDAQLLPTIKMSRPRLLLKLSSRRAS